MQAHSIQFYLAPMSLLPLSVCLVVLRSLRALEGPMAGCSRASFEVPPPDLRDPERCEPYEYELQGSTLPDNCQKSCFISGYFGRLRINDAHPRKVSQCQIMGTYCIARIIIHDQVNVTYDDGRCTADCRCVPKSQYNWTTHIDEPYVPSNHRNQGRQQVPSGFSHLGSVKLHIPDVECRNRTACEDYESTSHSKDSEPRFRCKRICSVYGSIAQLDFEGEPRVLGIFEDGSDCSIDTHKQHEAGRCVKGVCRPFSWAEPLESTTSMAQKTDAPGQTAVSVLGRTAPSDLESLSAGGPTLDERSSTPMTTDSAMI